MAIPVITSGNNLLKQFFPVFCNNVNEIIYVEHSGYIPFLQESFSLIQFCRQFDNIDESKMLLSCQITTALF